MVTATANAVARPKATRTLLRSVSHRQTESPWRQHSIPLVNREVLRNRHRSRSARDIGSKIETSFHVAPQRGAARLRHCLTPPDGALGDVLAQVRAYLGEGAVDRTGEIGHACHRRERDQGQYQHVL